MTKSRLRDPANEKRTAAAHVVSDSGDARGFRCLYASLAPSDRRSASSTCMAPAALGDREPPAEFRLGAFGGARASETLTGGESNMARRPASLEIAAADASSGRFNSPLSERHAVRVDGGIAGRLAIPRARSLQPQSAREMSINNAIESAILSPTSSLSEPSWRLYPSDSFARLLAR